MKTGKVKGIETLLGLRWRVDPLSDAVANFILDVIYRLRVQLIMIGFVLSVALNVFQVLSKALLVICDQTLADAEGVVICSSMKQIVSILVIEIRQAQRVH